MSAVHLKPCPYCGRAARYVAEDYVDNRGEPWPFAECDACNTGAPVEFWNKRAQSADQQGETAYTLAEQVRESLDRQACPGVWMNIAYEAVVKNYRHAQPATEKVDEALADFLASIAVDGLPDYLGPDQLDGSDPLNHANPYEWFRWNGKFRPIAKYEICDVVLRSGEVLSAIDPHEVEWDDGGVVAARYTPCAKLNGIQS